MGIIADIKIYRAWCKFKGRAKEAWAMQDKPAHKSKTVVGSIIMALIPLWLVAGAYFKLDPTLVNAVAALLGAIGGPMTVAGARDVAGGIKVAVEKKPDKWDNHPANEA